MRRLTPRLPFALPTTKVAKSGIKTDSAAKVSSLPRCLIAEQVGELFGPVDGRCTESWDPSGFLGGRLDIEQPSRRAAVVLATTASFASYLPGQVEGVRSLGQAWREMLVGKVVVVVMMMKVGREVENVLG